MLARLLEVEHALAFAYRHVLTTVTLDHGAERLVRLVALHERAHVVAIGAALRAAGGVPRRAPADVRAADRLLEAVGMRRRLAPIRRRAAAIDFLLALEVRAEGLYFDAAAVLSRPAAIRTAMSVMADEAQHATALRLLQRPKSIEHAVPGPFVMGRR
jgi:hypothetical protein